VAWWEGDTLVTETRNVNPIQEGRTLTPVSAQGTVTERFTRIGKSELLYQFTVDDPTHYTQAWSGEYSFKPAKGQIYEYACHEGNYAMEGRTGPSAPDRPRPETGEAGSALAAPPSPLSPRGPTPCVSPRGRRCRPTAASQAQPPGIGRSPATKSRPSRLERPGT
jgi:hypothetical protein